MNRVTTFYDVYRFFISPRLRAIDVFLHTAAPPYNPADVAMLLMLAPNTMPNALDRAAVLQLMEQRDSFICRLYRREQERGMPILYTREDIAYIYGLPHEDVNAAYDALHAAEATAAMLPRLFAEIPVREAISFIIS